ncbi:MAG: hypothetical protein ACRYF3_03405 [Janthinobacterium lividum]
MARQQTSSPLDHERLARRALRDLKDPFTAWVRESSQPHDHADHEGHDHEEEMTPQDVLEVLTLSLGVVLYRRASASKPSATAFEPAEIERLVLDPPPPIFDGVPDEEAQPAILAVWQDFFEFLADTDRWTGPTEELEACRQLLDEATVGDRIVHALSAAVEDVEAEQEDSAVLASFPAQVVAVVLERVGSGLVLTSDQDLRPADVAAVVAALDQPLPEPSAGGETTLEDVSWLFHIWALLIDCGLIALTVDDDVDRAALTPDAAHWSGVDDEARDLRREVVGRWLLEDPTTLTEGESGIDLLMPSVLGAVLTEGQVDEQIISEWLEDLLAPEDRAAAAADVLGRIADLGHFGIVSASTPWSIERGLWPAIGWALLDAFSDEDGDEDSDDDVDDDGDEERN